MKPGAQTIFTTDTLFDIYPIITILSISFDSKTPEKSQPFIYSPQAKQPVEQESKNAFFTQWEHSPLTAGR